MNKINYFKCQVFIVLVLLVVLLVLYSVIVLDCICVIFNGNENLIIVMLKNGNVILFYFVQVWLEDDKFVKDICYFIVLLLLQCIELKFDGQVKVQLLLVVVSLLQDWESLFYFNVWEILLKSDKFNMFQLVL